MPRRVVTIDESQRGLFDQDKPSISLTPPQSARLATLVVALLLEIAEHGLQLLAQKIRDQTPIRFLERDRQDAANLFQGCRLPVFEEAEERLDGGQPEVARHGRVLAHIARCSRKALTRRASSEWSGGYLFEHAATHPKGEHR
jgi:hypothetical protein